MTRCCPSCATHPGASGAVAWTETETVVDLLHQLADATAAACCVDDAADAIRVEAAAIAAIAAIAEGITTPQRYDLPPAQPERAYPAGGGVGDDTEKD